MIFGAIMDFVNPFDDGFLDIGDLAEASFDDIFGMIEAAVTFDFGDMLVQIAELEVIPGVTLGDIASYFSEILDKYPWLRTAIIVAAGAATGGAGALIAAAALTANDALARANDGEFTWDDFKGNAMQAAGNAAVAVTAGGAGAMVGLGGSAATGALATTASQVQFAAQMASQVFADTEFGKYIAIAGSAATMDWGTTMGAVQNIADIAEAVTAAAGEEDAARIIGALAAASRAEVRSVEDAIGTAGAFMGDVGLIEEETAALISEAVAARKGGYTATEIAQLSTEASVQLGVMDGREARMVSGLVAVGEDVADGGLEESDLVTVGSYALSVGRETGVIDGVTTRLAQEGLGLAASGEGVEWQDGADLALGILDAAGLDEDAVRALGTGLDVVRDGELDVEDIGLVLRRSGVAGDAGGLISAAVAAVEGGDLEAGDLAALLRATVELTGSLPPEATAALGLVLETMAGGGIGFDDALDALAASGEVPGWALSVAEGVGRMAGLNRR